MIKACIFDLDGVLVDTAVFHYQAWKRLADELGIDFTEEDNERLKGISRERSLEILLSLGGKEYDAQEKAEMAHRKNEWYKVLISHMRAEDLLPGVLDSLQTLKKKKIKIALGSSSKNARTILDQTNITSFFDAIIDGTNITTAKPDPEVFLKGAEELGVDPEEVIVFEDAVAGIEAALNGGMHAIGIGDPEVLTKAKVVIPSLAEFDTDKHMF